MTGRILLRRLRQLLKQYKMATEQEVLDAENQVNDIVKIEEALTALSDIIGETGETQVFIERNGKKFNLSSLRSLLTSGNINELDAMEGIENIVLDLVGPNEVTINTIREALRGLVDSHDVDIAAT